MITSYLVFSAYFWRILLHLSRAAAGFQTAPFLLSLFPLVAKRSRSLHVLLASPFNQPSSKRFVLIHYSHKDSKYWMLLFLSFFFILSFVCAAGAPADELLSVCALSAAHLMRYIYCCAETHPEKRCPIYNPLVWRPRARAHHMRENTIW